MRLNYSAVLHLEPKVYSTSNKSVYNLCSTFPQAVFWHELFIKTLSVIFVFPQAYIQKVETIDMIELGQRLVDSKNCLAFLIECSSFSPADIRLNNNVFQWYGRMEEIFDEHRKIIKEKAEQYQDGLKVDIIDILNYFHFLSMFNFYVAL